MRGEVARAMSDAVGLCASGDPVEGELVDGGVAVVRIGRFVRNVASRVYNVLRRLGHGEIEHVVLDLRACPGGVLDAAQQLAEDFLERGQVIAIRRDGEDDEVAL